MPARADVEVSRPEVVGWPKVRRPVIGVCTVLMHRRDGQSGLSNDDTTDINNYKTGVQWIESQLNSGHLTDNEAFYYDVVAI